MRCFIDYACVSHRGNSRRNNQDNYCCGGAVMDGAARERPSRLTGRIREDMPALLGVFDGMGGEERGEVASLLAAREAARICWTEDPIQDLLDFCRDANEGICRYAADNGVSSMGTTAALLAFAPREVVLCNIGDSRIYRYSKRGLEQISMDHISLGVQGRKPPLSQNLGIPPEELRIEPYLAKGPYHPGDLYLICSDGLTDELNRGEIETVLQSGAPPAELADTLLDQALAAGGRDNTTIIVCRVEKDQSNVFTRFLKHHLKNERT